MGVRLGFATFEGRSRAGGRFRRSSYEDKRDGGGGRGAYSFGQKRGLRRYAFCIAKA